MFRRWNRRLARAYTRTRTDKGLLLQHEALSDASHKRLNSLNIATTRENADLEKGLWGTDYVRTID